MKESQVRYQEKLQNPHWLDLKRRMLKERGPRCEGCGADPCPKLELHHGCYERGKEPWQADPETLWLLCNECHDEFQHRLDDIWKEVGRINPNEHFRLLVEIRKLDLRDKGHKQRSLWEYEYAE